MNIMIFCDMEGISGICRASQVTAGAADYHDACVSMTADVNACIRGCIEGGASKIVVRDVHATCSNIIWKELDARVDSLISGIPGQTRFAGIDDFDGLILLGYHAMAGTCGGILAHTSSSAWQNCWVNGIKAGEFFLDGARAGEHGVPVIMTSGDDKLCAEARFFNQAVIGVQVKEGISRESGRLLSSEESCRRICDGAKKAVSVCDSISPMSASSPVSLRVEYSQGAGVCVPHSESGDSRIFEVYGKTLEEAVNMLPA